MDKQKSKFSLRRILFWYVWFPITIINQAIDIINIQVDFWPAWLSWSEFLLACFQWFKELRDFLLSPFTGFLAWFGISLPSWLKSYLFTGLIVFSHFILALRIFARKDKLKGYSNDLKSLLILFLSSIVLWPFVLFSIVVYFLIPKQKLQEAEEHFPNRREFNQAHNSHEIARFWGRFIALVFITIILFVFIDSIIRKMS